MSILLRDHFQCQMCGRIQIDTSKLVCDHDIPHRGNPDLFWEESNLKTLCADPCHNTAKRREEWSTRHQRGDWGLSDNLFWPRCQASAVPLTIVCGPPAAGKSTFVAQRAAEGDLIIDLDQIIATLFPSHARTRVWEMRRDGLLERNGRLRKLSQPCLAGHAWFTTGAATPAQRMHWADTLRPVRMLVIPTPLQTCIDRINADPTRAVGAHEQASAVRRWWSDYVACDRDEIFIDH